MKKDPHRQPTYPGGSVRQGVQRQAGRRPLRRGPDEGPQSVRGSQRLRCGQGVHRRGRERPDSRQAPVSGDDRRRAARTNAPFEVILVWKFSRFTRKREHAVAFKSMLRRKGIRVVSITEHADDSPYRQAHGGHHRERGRVLQLRTWPRR